MSQKEVLVEVIIEDFSEYIQLSKKRKIIPYILGKNRIPKKYSNPSLYGFDYENRLIEISTGDIIVRNTRTAGKPRLLKVNGQSIYNGSMAKYARAILIKTLHEYFREYFKDVEFPSKKSYPLTLELIFRVHYKGKGNIDNDNKWIWRKCLQDTLTELGKIPDDNVKVISKNIESTEIISDKQAQQLIIKLYSSK